MSTAACPVPQTDFIWPSGIRGAVSLTFDDSRPSQLDAGMPVFDKHGVHATFYVLPHAVRERIEDWRRAASVGHELGSHTLTHPCSGNFSFSTGSALENMTPEQMESELVESQRQIEQLAGVRPVSFAYPCGQKFVGRGETLRSYVPLVARHYLTGRGWRDEYFNAPSRCDLAQLGGVQADNAAFADIEPQLQEAARSGTWLVLAGHDIGPEPSRQTMTLAALEAVCAFCADPENGLWLDTVGTIGGYIRRTRGF